MIPASAVAPAAAVTVALFCAVRGLVALPANLLDSLVAPALIVTTCAALLVAAMWSGGRAMRTYRYRIDPGGAPAGAIDHEVAHADKSDQFGGRVVRGRVFANGSGYVDVRMPPGAPIAHYVAVDMAGARGEGENFWTSPHARGDRANAADRVAHLSQAERDAVYRQAERLAAPRWWASGQAAAVRRALQETGAYR
jgi:hypothetical protein